MIDMDSIKCGPTITNTAIFHFGEWNDYSRKVPALNFFEKHDNTVIGETTRNALPPACSFSSTTARQSIVVPKFGRS
jgi:hypothetical protein